MRRDMDRRVLPVDDLSVHPDLAGKGETHTAILASGALVNC
jgi:hypothetical protein